MAVPSDSKWNKIAYPGTFKGHAAGGFSLDDRVFSEIVRNFKKDDRPVVVDFEHSSEAEASGGSIPVSGVPAAGWIHALENRGADGLWALVEWLEPAKSYIKDRKYVSVSPAIRFGSKDRVSGEPIGARLTSLALTNNPYLNRLPAIAAKDLVAPIAGTLEYAADSVVLRANLAHGPHEYMPPIRAALRMPDLSTARECSDQLERLRGHFDGADGDPNGSHEGVSLGDYMMALRTCSGAQPGATWDDVFDVVQDLIDAAIGEHVIEDHGGEENDPSDAAMASLDDDETGAAMSDTTPKEETMTIKADEQTISLSEHKAQAALLTDAQTQVSTLTLRLTETSTELATLKVANAALKDAEATRTAKDQDAEVESAFLTYKDKKGLTEDLKPHMLATLKATPDSFRAMYPAVKATEQHLLREVAPKRDPQPATKFDTAETGKPISLREFAQQIAEQKGISLAEAQDIAVRSLSPVKSASAR